MRCAVAGVSSARRQRDSKLTLWSRWCGLQVVDDGTNWRGRAQKIVMLKAKVRELQGRLQDQGPRSDVDGRARAELQVTCHSSCADAPPSLPRVLVIPTFTQLMEAERKRSVEALTEEFHAVQEQAVQYKRKAEAAKARVTVLERQTKKAKENIKVRTPGWPATLVRAKPGVACVAADTVKEDDNR